MKDWMKQWRRLLVRVGLLPPAELHYIGGSDTLPPPLSREREAELLGRLDEVIVFRPLAEENLCAIAEKMLCQLEQRAARSGYRLRHTPQVGAALAARAQSAYGARELRRQVDRAVEQALANRIAAGTACVGQHWTADCAADGSIVLREDETITL